MDTPAQKSSKSPCFQTSISSSQNSQVVNASVNRKADALKVLAGHYIQRAKSRNAKKLAVLIKKQDFDGISLFLKKYPNLINHYYQDKNGNTILHLAVCHFLPAYLLVALGEHGFPVMLSNILNKKPIDLVKTPWHKYEIETIMNVRFYALHYRLSNILYNHVVAKYFLTDSYPGKWIVNNLSLTYGEKNDKDFCDIPNRWKLLDQHDGLSLTLHERLSIACDYTASLVNSRGGLPDNNYNFVTASISFVIRNSVGMHFVTLPVSSSYWSLCVSQREKGDEQHPHSEFVLYEYLKRQPNVNFIVNVLVKSFHPSFVYAVILDIHSKENDMCVRCEEKSYAFLGRRNKGSFLDFLEKALVSRKIGLPKVANFNKDNVFVPISSRLHTVVRVSCRKPYGMSGQPHYARPVFNKEAGSIRKIKIRHFNHEDEIDSEDLAVSTSSSEVSQLKAPSSALNRNIKLFKNSVLLHVSPNNYRQHSAKYNKMLVSNKASFFNQTVFLNYKPSNKFRPLKRAEDELNFRIISRSLHNK